MCMLSIEPGKQTFMSLAPKLSFSAREGFYTRFSREHGGMFLQVERDRFALMGIFQGLKAFFEATTSRQKQTTKVWKGSILTLTCSKISLHL